MWPFKKEESSLKPGTVAGIGGVLAAAGAAVWYLLGRKNHKTQPKKASHGGHGKGEQRHK